MGLIASIFDSRLFKHSCLRRYTAIVQEDLTATYSRAIQKWLLVAPIIGIATGLAISAITVIILGIVSPRILAFFLEAARRYNHCRARW